MCVTFLKNPTPSVSPKSIPGDGELSNGKSRKDWILGCFYLLTGVTIFDCNTVMQAAALKRFPASLSVCSITAMIGSIFSAIIKVLMEGKLTAGTTDNITWIIGEIGLVVYTHTHQIQNLQEVMLPSCNMHCYGRMTLLLWQLQGGVVIELCTTFQGLSFGRKDPVLVSMFSPFQTVFSEFISLIFFGQCIGLG